MKIFKKKRSVLSTDTKLCRICLDEGDQTDIISPCRCSGGSEYVHRSCLDQWRSMNKNGHSFTHCDVCQFEFVIETVVDDPSSERKRLWLFRFLVTRDLALIMALIQGVILGLTFLMRYLDRDSHAILDLFPQSMTEIGIYYLSALIIFLAVLGLLGIIAGCCGMLLEDDPTNSSGCRGYGCIWLGCSCNNCGGSGDCDGCGDCKGGGGGGGEAIIIIILILAAVGLIVGIIISIIVAKKIIARHTKRLWLRQEAKKFVVKDFQGRRNELSINGTSTPYPTEISATNLLTRDNRSDKISFVPIHAIKSTDSTAL